MSHCKKETEPFLSSGLAKINLEKHEDAIIDFNEAIRIDPDCAYAYFKRGIAKVEIEKYEEAIIDFNKSIELDPKSAVSYYNRGLVNSELNNFEESIADYTQAIRLDPKFSAAYAGRGGVRCYNLSYFKMAIADFDWAIELEPNNSSYYYSRGNAKKGLGLIWEAISDYNQSIELEPNHSDVYNNRGNVKNKVGFFEEAIVDFNRAIKIDPRNVMAYSNRGSSKDRLGYFEEAIIDCDQAIEIDPRDVGAYVNRGLAKFHLSLFDEAIVNCTQAINIDPKCALAYCNRGFAKLHSNKWDKKDAISDFLICLKEDRNFLLALIAIDANSADILSEKERDLYQNRFRYLAFQSDQKLLWLQMQEYQEIRPFFLSVIPRDDSNIWALIDFIEHSLDSWEGSPQDRQQAFRALSLIYNLLGFPDRVFSIIDKMEDIFGDLSPLDHYLFIWSAWQIAEPKHTIIFLMQDARKYVSARVFSDELESAFAQCLTQLSRSSLEDRFTSSDYYPLYSFVDLPTPSVKNLETISQPEPYKIRFGDIEWDTLVHRLTLAFIRQESIDKVIIIQQEEISWLQLKGILRSLEKISSEVVTSPFPRKLSEREIRMQQKALTTSVDSFDDFVRQNVQTMFDVEIIIRVLFNRYLSTGQGSEADHRHFAEMVLYLLFFEVFREREKSKRLAKKIVVIGADALGYFSDDILNQFLFSHGQSLAETVFFITTVHQLSDAGISKIFPEKEFPSLPEFWKGIGSVFGKSNKELNELVELLRFLP